MTIAGDSPVNVPTKVATEIQDTISPYRNFTAAEWGKLRKDTPLPLSEAELEELKGFGERVSLDEVSEIYLPLSRLINLYVRETQELYRVTSDFLGHAQARYPILSALPDRLLSARARQRVSCVRCSHAG